jgi:hypothetical protein
MQKLITSGLAATTLLCLVTTGCTASSRDADQTGGAGGVVVRHGASMVPADTLQDLVTYGDVAVVVDVVAEAELPPVQADVDRGEGTITRQVTAQQVGAPVWVRPSRSKTAPLPKKEWKAADGGWVFHGAKRTRIVDEGQDALVVGSRYLAVRTFSTIGGVGAPEWISLAYFPLDGGKVRYSQRTLDESSPQLQRLQGATQTAVRSALTTTAPSSAAKPYMELDAFNRYEKAVG